MNHTGKDGRARRGGRVSKIPLDRDLLHSLYWEQGLTMTQIAARFGLRTQRQIQRLFKKLDIPCRRAGTRPGSRIGGKLLRHIPDDRALLYDLYWKQDMTLEEVAAQFGVTTWPAFTAMKDLGIPVRPGHTRPGRALSQRIERLVPQTLPPDIRTEVKQELAFQILARRLKPTEAEQLIKQLVRNAFKECRGNLKEISLDAPIRSDGVTTWAEMLEG